MSLEQRLYNVAKAGLTTANQNNPFWSKRQAMQSINFSAKLLSNKA